MSVARVACRALVGLHAPLVHVEVSLASGLPAFCNVGLPATVVKESKERVRAALLNSRFEFPAGRITVNLARAALAKEGGRFDLPIALGILTASGQIRPRGARGGGGGETREFDGELGVTGELKPVRGLLLAAAHAQQQGHELVVPRANAAEACVVAPERVRAAGHLLEVCGHLSGAAPLPACAPPRGGENRDAPSARGAPLDLADVRGQLMPKRALVIAAAGGHSLLMIGPPGSGKSMLAQRLPGLLPPLTRSEALEVAAIAAVSAAGFTPAQLGQRPFRAPHHTASSAALVGGGARARPGEISFAHHGVLFLDELPEFQPQVLDSLRQPLEIGEVAIARANHRVTYPARFMLVAAMNPCRCGRATEPGFACKRGTNARCAAEYQGRLSGPLIDRIDLHIEVPAVTAADLILPPPTEGSREVAARVARARAMQAERYAAIGLTQLRTNAHANGPLLEEMARPDSGGLALLRDAAEAMRLSARGYHRVLRVARTLADLDGADKVGRVHLAEALSYRALVDEIRRAA